MYLQSGQSHGGSVLIGREMGSLSGPRGGAGVWLTFQRHRRRVVVASRVRDADLQRVRGSAVTGTVSHLGESAFALCERTPRDHPATNILLQVVQAVAVGRCNRNCACLGLHAQRKQLESIVYRAEFNSGTKH